MKTVNSFITLLLLSVAVFSVATSGAAIPLQASTSEEAIESGEAAPPEDSFEAAPAISEDEEENDEDYTVTCWNGEEVAELSDCPEDDGEIICDDGSTAIRISDCPESGLSPPPFLPPTTAAPLPPVTEGDLGASTKPVVPFPNQADEGEFNPDEAVCLT